MNDKRPRLDLVGGAQHDDAVQAPQVAEIHQAVRAARGGEIGAADHEALLALALGQDVQMDDAPLAAERAEAEALRDALAESEAGARSEPLGARGDGGGHPLALFAQAIASVHHPRPLDDLAHERILRRGLSGAGSAGQARRRAWPIAAALAALAAGAALVLSRPFGGLPHGAPVEAPALLQARSTEGLFDPRAAFPARGGDSDRMARIVVARAQDLRANRFAQWGVR